VPYRISIKREKSLKKERENKAKKRENVPLFLQKKKKNRFQPFSSFFPSIFSA